MTTVPDINVRPAPHGAPGNARAARHSTLARLLLRLSEHVSKLDRKLLLLLVVSPLSACVIPAGPEFQDPPGVPNAPPYVVAVSPIAGLTIASNDTFFSVTPGDINLADTIYVKWITEYPPDLTNLTKDLSTDEITPSADGSPTRRASIFVPSCTRVNPLVTTHQIMAAISDRKFVTGQLLATESNVPPREVFWFWQQTCTGSQ